jgi:hypothetical protein
MVYGMTKIQKRSAAVLIVVLIGTSIVSYFGLRSNAEANVYRTVFTQLKSESGETAWSGTLALLSKPGRCDIDNDKSTKWVDIPKQIVHEFIEANSGNAKPVKLTSLEGVVPIVIWKDNKRLHSAGYNWKPEDQPVLAVSRVGLNYPLNKALLCVEKIVPSMLGGFAVIFFLEKEDGRWVVKINRIAWVS